MNKGKELFFRWKAIKNSIDNISDIFRKPDSLLTKEDVRKYNKSYKKMVEHMEIVKKETDKFLRKEVEE